MKITSEEPECNLYADGYRDGLAIFLSGLKFPVTNRFQSFLVETHTQSALHLQSARTSVGIDDHAQNHSSLILSLARLLRVLRIGLVDCARRGYAANSGTEHSPAVSTTDSRSDAAARS